MAFYNKNQRPKEGKLKIYAYEDPKFSIPVKGMKKPLSVSINPDSYERTFLPLNTQPIKIGNGQIVGRKIVDPAPESFTLKLNFDGTGAIPGTNDVSLDVEKFKRYALYFNGKIHSQNFLKLEWGGSGDLTFKGQLQSLKVNYTLFDAEGKPLRAVADATFKQVIDPITRHNLKKRSSPDLTHLRTVKAGDNLPLMCFRIYGKSDYYVQVAQANGLKNIMDLEPGSQIIFPPLEK